MECKLCSKKTFSQIKCHICNNILCSNSCLDSHFLFNHKSIIYSNNKIYEKPKIDRIINNDTIKPYSIISPYITDGFILNTIRYETIYKLNNFTPILENNSPKIIGIGSYGKVYLYRNITDKKLYAIKHLNKMILCKSIHTIKRIYDEINIQSRIYHKNIVRLKYVKENDDSIFLIMEYANNGSLFNYIRKKGMLTEDESFKFFSQVINAIYFLHKNDLIHRDIKPENILIFDNGLCKLCDFGCCVELNGKRRTTFCGTTEYMSPEIVNNMEYSKEIDIWSLGILLYEMIHGSSPFKPTKDEFNTKEVIDKIKIHNLQFNLKISKECKELICHLLEENPKNRYKIEDIFNSDFVKKYERINFNFNNEKHPINNIKSYDKNIFTERNYYENPLLLSSLIENENIINRTLFNNVKYNSTNNSNMKNKINNVIFNNVLNKKSYNKDLFNNIDNKKLNTSRPLNRKINIFNINSNTLSSNLEYFENLNPKGNKKVKVTKLSSKDLISNDNIIQNISNIKNINNDIDISKEVSFLNLSSIINQNNNNGKIIINKKYKSINPKENTIHKLIKSSSIKNIKEKNKSNDKYELHHKNVFSQTSRKEKPLINNNIIFNTEINRIQKKDWSNIKNKYYIKPKIQKEYQMPKDNSKIINKKNKNVLHFKNCFNSKIKIPRRKILSSLQLDNINIVNNIDLLNNNDIPSLNSSNQLNLDNSQVNEYQNDFSFIDNKKNNSHRNKHNNIQNSYLNDNTISTQINKNYIFNPKISINFPSFTSQTNNHNKKNNVKIKEIVEDFKDKIEPHVNLSKSQTIQKNKSINNVKIKYNNKLNSLFNSEGENNEIKNSLVKNDNNKSSRISPKRKMHKIKNNNTNNFFEHTYQSKNKDYLLNISPIKNECKNNKKNILSKSMSNSFENLNDFNDTKIKEDFHPAKKKINMKQKEIKK